MPLYYTHLLTRSDLLSLLLHYRSCRRLNSSLIRYAEQAEAVLHFNPLFSERIISLSVDVNSCCLIFFSVYDQHSFQRICHDFHMNFLANRKFIIEVVIIKLSSESNSSVIHDADIMYIIFSARCICFKQDLSCSCFFS